MGTPRILRCLLACYFLVMTSRAEQPSIRDDADWEQKCRTENKYKTAHSKQTWMMALTLPYLLRDSVENKYLELFHNHTFLPYLMRSPTITKLPTEGSVPLRAGDPKLSAALDGRLAQLLGRVENKAKEGVATKSYTIGRRYSYTNTLGQDMRESDIESDWIPNRADLSANIPEPVQKGRNSPKIQPRLWKCLVNPRGHWEKNRTFINGISDSFDPDYDAWNESHPFPNGNQAEGGAYDSEISMLKRRSMCPNIIFHTLGPGEHPVNNPLYMDSDYNFRDIPNFNGTWHYPNDSRSSSGESRMDPNEALKRAEYFRSMLNKTREERKIMDEYTTGFYDRDYCLGRKRRAVNLGGNPVELQNAGGGAVKGPGHVEKAHRKRRNAQKRGEKNSHNMELLAPSNREKRNARRIKRIDDTMDTEDAGKVNARHAKHRRNVDNPTRCDAYNGTIENIDDFINEGNGFAKRAQNEKRLQNADTDGPEEYKQQENENNPVSPTEHKPIHLTLQPVQPPLVGERPASDEIISIQANLDKREFTNMEEIDLPKTTVDYFKLVTPVPETPAKNDTARSRKHCRCNRLHPNQPLYNGENNMGQLREREQVVDTQKKLDYPELTKKPYQHKAIEIYHELKNIMESLQLKTKTQNFPGEKQNEKTDVNNIEEDNEKSVVKENNNGDNELREMMESLQLKTKALVIPGITRQKENPNVNKGTHDTGHVEADQSIASEEKRTQPPQKDRLEPADLNRKIFAERKRKVRIDDNKLYESMKLEAIRNEYVKACKGQTWKKRTTRDFLDAGFVTDNQDVKCVDEQHAKTDVQADNPTDQTQNGTKEQAKLGHSLEATTETARSHLNKCKFLYGELKKKYDMHLSSSEREEKRQVRERIQFLKDMVKHKYAKLNVKTADKVKDYRIDKTEEMAGFPVEWYAKNKHKVRTSTEIEEESIDQELEAELKAARMRMGHNQPKKRARRATKVLIRRNNASFVVSYKHLNLFRRKNVKIYLNHEHLRKFDRMKRHVPERLESGFDSENEFNGDEKATNNHGNDDGKVDGTDYFKVKDGQSKIKNGYVNEGKPIFLDTNDLVIRHTDSITSDEDFQGIELRADDIVDSNYGDPDDIVTEKEINENQFDTTNSLNNEDVFERAVHATSINPQSTTAPVLDPVNNGPMKILLRRKRWEQPVYVTKPKGGWKKYVKSKIKEIKKKMSTKWRDRIIEWTTKHKWETLPDEKDRTTVKQTKKFLNIKKIRQMI